MIPVFKNNFLTISLPCVCDDVITVGPPRKVLRTSRSSALEAIKVFIPYISLCAEQMEPLEMCKKIRKLIRVGHKGDDPLLQPFSMSRNRHTLLTRIKQTRFVIDWSEV